MDEDIIWNTARVWAERPNGDISEVYGFREGGGKQSIYHNNRRIYTSDSGAMLDNILPDQEKLTMPQEEAAAPGRGRSRGHMSRAEARQCHQ